jgi:protein AbiQ
MSSTISFQYVKLTTDFYNDYPHNQFPEILLKDHRPYIHISVKIDGLTFVLPLRSKVDHSVCFPFKLHDNDKRAIDYSKAIIVNDPQRYIVSYDQNIPQSQHIYISKKINVIQRQFEKYIREYKKAIIKNDKNALYRLRNKYSSLQYFHLELGLV